MPPRPARQSAPPIARRSSPSTAAGPQQPSASAFRRRTGGRKGGGTGNAVRGGGSPEPSPRSRSSEGPRSGGFLVEPAGLLVDLPRGDPTDRAGGRSRAGSAYGREPHVPRALRAGS